MGYAEFRARRAAKAAEAKARLFGPIEPNAKIAAKQAELRARLDAAKAARGADGPAGVSQAPGAAAEPSAAHPEPVRYEYRTERLVMVKRNRNKIERLQREGWEIVSHGSEINVQVYHLRRPLP